MIELDNAMSGQSDEFASAATHPDDAGFWLYSSGSTGKPKGVVHLQHDIEATCESFGEGVLSLGEDDVTFSTTKMFHAYGLGNTLYPLWFGGTSVLMPGSRNPAAILNALRRHKPTVFYSVPALYSAIVRENAAEGAFNSVRICVSAAERLSSATLRRWRTRFGVDIIDGIGATEMFIQFCSNRPGIIAPGTAGLRFRATRSGCSMKMVSRWMVREPERCTCEAHLALPAIGGIRRGLSEHLSATGS